MVESGVYQVKPDDVIALQIKNLDNMELDDVRKEIQNIIKFMPKGYIVERVEGGVGIIHTRDGEKREIRAKYYDVLVKRVGDENNWGIYPELAFVRKYEQSNSYRPINKPKGEIVW